MNNYILLAIPLAIFLFAIFFSPNVQSIPPTPAFTMINSSSGNITAATYNSFVEFVSGTGMTIGFNNTSNEITFSSASGGTPHEKYCYPNALSNFNATTLDYDCVTIPTGSGQNNTASSSGLGQSLVLPKSGVDLPFKGIAVSGDLTIGSNGTDITIGHAGGSAGEANTMSSPTHANSLVLAKVGVDLPIKGIACSGTVTCSANTTDITLSSSGSSGITSVNSAPATTAKILQSNSTTKATLKTLTQGTGITLTNGSSAVTVATSFKVDSLSTIAVDKFISAYDNATGDWTTKTFSVNTKDCGTQAVKSLDNSTGDVTCISVGATAREETVASWEAEKTWTNIGTSYVDVYLTANSNGHGMRIDTAGKTTVTLDIMWTKVGVGTQKCQIVDIASGSNILIAATNLASGQNINATVTIPAGLANTIKTYKPQCLATTSTDDPVWLSGQVLLK